MRRDMVVPHRQRDDRGRRHDEWPDRQGAADRAQVHRAAARQPRSLARLRAINA